KHYIKNHGYAPTLSEIAKAFKLSSLATVHEHLSFLEKTGYIKRDKNNARGIEILEAEDKPEFESASMLLPLVGTIAAGSPIEAIEDRQDMIPVPPNLVGKKNAYILKVRGDSMVESLVGDGDMVVVEKTQLAKDGDMVVALLDDGSATLKKFFRKKNFIRLQPANANYQPIDVKNVTIQGRVIGVIRRY
ncbi:transcriptional repressor LexA, partial [Candidatus Parcubacteria bacterium]